MSDKPESFTIRSLTESDMEAVSRLDLLSDNNVSAMLDSEGFAWGVFLQDKLIGYCTIGGADELEGKPRFSEYPTFSSSDCYLLSDVFIDPDYRGNGYAVALIKEVIKQATKDQPEHVFLSLLDPALSSLYQKLGFQNIDMFSMVFDKKDLPRLIDSSRRILSDIYWKNRPRLWGDDVSTQFNQISTAVNAMFGWLYENKILQQTAFELRDYSDATYFTVDMQDLLPYRKQMEASGLSNANLALKKSLTLNMNHACIPAPSPLHRL